MKPLTAAGCGLGNGRTAQSLVRLIVKRKPQALLPWFVGPLLALDDAVGGRLGDWYLGGKFFPGDARPGT